MSTEVISKFEITNSCTCTTYNEDTGEWDTAPECWGDCWETQVEDFTTITEELFNNNDTNWWKVTGLQLWNGSVGGYFQAKTPVDLLRGMTVNSEWIMRGTAYPDRIEYSLSHHDAPMGSSTVLLPVSEEEREESGLY